MRFGRVEVERGLERASGPEEPVPGKRRSAVLLPLFECAETGEARILYILRPEFGAFGGQIAFPGGKVEAEDPSDREAALREAEEELSIPLDAWDVKKKLGHFPTLTSNYDVAVHVAWWRSPTVCRPAPDEVAAVFSVSVGRLIERFGVRGSTLPEDYVLRDLARGFPTEPAAPFDGASLPVLWGVSARITGTLLAGLID